MTMLEFEAWVSDHYEELRGIAATVTRNSPQAEDHLHNLIESVCSGELPLPEHLETGWFASKVHGRQRNTIGSDRITEERLKGRFAQSVLTIGPEDTFLDLTRQKKAANARRQKLAKRSAANSPDVLEETASRLFNGQSGDTRWRYQQLRDGRLFNERAVRSLADSMHRTSQRYRHFGQAGFSHVEWGTERVHA